MKSFGPVTGIVLGVLLGALMGHTLVVLAASSRNLVQENENMDIAVEFYDRLLNQLDFESARELMGDYYIQHNPHATDGFEGIKEHIDMLKQTYPENHGDIKRVMVNGDLVALHVHSKRTPDSLGNAIVDIFRIEDGKVVEHWDVVQAVPETSMNSNTMF